MDNDIRNTNKRPEEQAQHLIDKLHNLYAEYIEKNRQYEERQDKSIGKIFSRWFSGSDPFATDPIHQEFLDNIDKIVMELTIPLSQLQQDAPEFCNDIAETAVRRLMAPQLPDRQPRSTGEWYMTVAEYQSAPLLPYLELKVMENLRSEMFKIPKRMMFPKQKKFFEKFEEILEEKRKQSNS